MLNIKPITKVEVKEVKKEPLPPIKNSALAHLSDDKKERKKQKQEQAQAEALKRQQQIEANKKEVDPVWYKAHTLTYQDHLKICDEMAKSDKWDSMEKVLAKFVA